MLVITRHTISNITTNTITHTIIMAILNMALIHVVNAHNLHISNLIIAILRNMDQIVIVMIVRNMDCPSIEIESRQNSHKNFPILLLPVESVLKIN